jgi:hypothetical protein
LNVIAENDGGREFHMAGEGDVLLYSYLTTLQTVTAVNHLDVALRGAQITRARISFVSESLFHRKSWSLSPRVSPHYNYESELQE